MKSKQALPASFHARQLKQRIGAAIQDYESNLGPIPLWFAELDPHATLSLMSACLRIGLRLPPEETLQADMIERAQAARGVGHRNTFKR
jgi:hypothetical protein